MEKIMKCILTSSAAFLFSMVLIAKEPVEIIQINIGDQLPGQEVKVKDISGEKITLAANSLENGLLVIFSCNTCPYVLGWEGRYPELYTLCKMNNVGMVVLNSNEAKRKNEDSFEAMVTHANEKNYSFPYAVDAKHKLADAFGATKTPDIFLFNNKGKLVYKGAIDDNMKEPEKVTEPFLIHAIINLVAGKEISPATTKAIGCSIKRIE